MPQGWIGSSKDIRYVPKEGLRLNFSERVSVFDVGPVPVLFPHLGELRCAIAVRIFNELDAAGFKTHFLRQMSRTEILVSPFSVPEKGVTFDGVEGRMLPLEFLFRHVATKKFCGRVKDGSIDRTKVVRCLIDGWDLEPGTRLGPPFVECSTKHQDADEYVSDEVAAKLARIDIETLMRIYDKVEAAAIFLKILFRQADFDLGDGKFEGAFLDDGSFVIADSISPDEVRLIGSDGESYDKDPLRKWYETERPDWVKVLNEAKRHYPTDKSQWPTYDAEPPQYVVKEVVRRYTVVAEAIGAI